MSWCRHLKPIKNEGLALDNLVQGALLRLRPVLMVALVGIFFAHGNLIAAQAQKCSVISGGGNWRNYIFHPIEFIGVAGFCIAWPTVGANEMGKRSA